MAPRPTSACPASAAQSGSAVAGPRPALDGVAAGAADDQRGRSPGRTGRGTGVAASSPAPLQAVSVPCGREPAVRHRRAEPLGAVDGAGDVVADVHHRPRRGSSRRARRSVATPNASAGGTPSRLHDIVERAGADPADPLLHRVQHGEQQVAPCARGVAAERGVGVAAPRARPPSRLGGPRTASIAAAFLLRRGVVADQAQCPSGEPPCRSRSGGGRLSGTPSPPGSRSP